MLSWERFVYFFPKVIVKFPVTLEIVLISFGSGLLLGCLLAWIRIKKIPVLSQIAAVFISYIRCTPVICQMFVVYFVVPALLGQMGIDSSAIDRVVYIYIAYGLNNGGFMGETIRSAVLAVPMGQTEAGYAAGLTGWQTLVHIVAPQAARISLPMMGTTFIYAFQATALAYMVGVIDMIGKTRSLGSVTGHTLEGYIICALVFAVLSLILEFLFNQINKRLDFGRSGMPAVRRRKAVQL